MFTYDPYRSPYSESIAESIAAPGRAQAQGVLNAGQAQAAGQQQSGAIWGNALQNIGQTVADLPRQMQIQKAQAQETEMRTLQLATLKRQQASQQVLSIAIKKFTDPQSGKRDDQGIANFVSQQGYPDQGEAWLKMAVGNAENLDKLAELGRGHQRHQLETLGDLAYSATSPAEFTAAVGLAAASGLIVNAQGQVDEEKAHEIAAQAATPEGWATIKAQYQVFSPKYQAAQAKLKEPIKVGEGEVVNTPERAAAGLGPLMTGAPKTPTGAEMDARAQVLYGKKAQGIALTKPEQAELTAYEERKRVISDPAATAAADRQASAISAAANRQATATTAQTDQQKRSQDFTEAQVGRKELTEKVEQPYQTATSSANALRDVVAAAKAGNKVAGSLQSLETTMAAIRAQGLNRINMAEIGVTAAAGSLWDRFEGAVAKATKGQPVPPNIQEDMIKFANILERAAYQKYAEGFKSTTGRYKLTDEKILPPPGEHIVFDANGNLVPKR